MKSNITARNEGINGVIKSFLKVRIPQKIIRNGYGFIARSIVRTYANVYTDISIPGGLK